MVLRSKNKFGRDGSQTVPNNNQHFYMQGNSFIRPFIHLELISYDLTEASGWAKPWTRLMLGACQSCDSLSWITTFCLLQSPTTTRNRNHWAFQNTKRNKYFNVPQSQQWRSSICITLTLRLVESCVMISYFVARNSTWPCLPDLHIVVLPPTAVYKLRQGPQKMYHMTFFRGPGYLKL